MDGPNATSGSAAQGFDAFDAARVERAVREMLAGLGEDPDRAGLRETPRRVAEAYAHLFSGLREDPLRHLDVSFSEGARDLVLVRDVPLASVCEHHLLPFLGRLHAAYLPEGRVVGFTEVVRVVGGYARRPQLQERLTAQVADALHTGLGSRGSLVISCAEHTCMTMRDAATTGTSVVTVAARGAFEEDAALRREVEAMLREGGR